MNKDKSQLTVYLKKQTPNNLILIVNDGVPRGRGRLPHRSLRPFRQLRCVRCVRCIRWKPRLTIHIQMFNYNRTLVLHGHGDTQPQILCGHDILVDLLWL